jgi:hypothetical protein
MEGLTAVKCSQLYDLRDRKEAEWNVGGFTTFLLTLQFPSSGLPSMEVCGSFYADIAAVVTPNGDHFMC